MWQLDGGLILAGKPLKVLKMLKKKSKLIFTVSEANQYDMNSFCYFDKFYNKRSDS